jgi:hypothetical protein
MNSTSKPIWCKLHVELCRLAQRRLYAPYLGDLTADVEVDELQAVLHIDFLQNVQSLQQFTRIEAELAGVAAALLPFACARRGELDADADVGPYTELLRHVGDDLQFVDLLHHEEDALAHLLRQQGQLYVALVLVAVADDERVVVHVGGNDGVELGLGTGFQSQVVFLAVADDFLHHRAHLIHLDGVDDEILAL